MAEISKQCFSGHLGWVETGCAGHATSTAPGRLWSTQQVCRMYRRHHCGYLVGIGFPPSWTGGNKVTGLRHDSDLEIKEGHDLPCHVLVHRNRTWRLLRVKLQCSSARMARRFSRRTPMGPTCRRLTHYTDFCRTKLTKFDTTSAPMTMAPPARSPMGRDSSPIAAQTRIGARTDSRRTRRETSAELI